MTPTNLLTLAKRCEEAVGIEVLDLFSAAAGGWSLGMHRAGFTTMAACEVEAWRRALYSENNPGVKVYDDVRTLTAARLLADLGRLPRIVVGSPPCQDISSANTKGRGVEGDRSSLYFEAVRIIDECRPRWFALENSANLRTRGADAVLAALEAIGYTCWPLVVRAGDVGANHERARSWLVGCDLAQVTDADRQFSDDWTKQSGAEGEGCYLPRAWAADRDIGWAAGAGAVSRRHGGLGALGDAEEDGCRPGLSGRCVEPAERLSVATCGDASGGPGDAAHPDEGGQLRGAIDAEMGELPRLGSDHGRNTPDPDQARQAPGYMEPGLRQAEIADDGRGPRRGDDGPCAGQVAICPADRRAALGHRADWSLDDLADHLRLDDGLSAWLAGTRVAIGDGKGTAAASLIVEAFGDAVVPQIPEAIGRAILRTEAALGAIYGPALSQETPNGR